MKDLNKIITEDLFLSSYRILHDYIDQKGDSIQDINLILVSEYLTSLKHTQIKKFYNKYVKTGLVYSLPDFFASDLVTIPKSVSDVREYRFFSTFGMILYNAFGIFFAETCSEMITNLNLPDRNIFSYAPTKYHDGPKWKVNNKWQQEYDKFKNKIIEKTNESDIVLSLDISNFFNSIKHKKLIGVINDFISAPNRKKYDFDGNSEDILSYYFLSMMGDSKGLPQGKKNFASDYLAFLYMVKFDMEVETLISSCPLQFVAIVRYVDDIHIFFKNQKNDSTPKIYKQLSKVEHTISKWLYSNLGLSLNNNKTLRKIILNAKQKKDFITSIEKKTSGPNKIVITKNELQAKVDNFIKAVRGFSYPDKPEFSDGLLGGANKENLKNIFDPNVRAKLAHNIEVVKMINVLKSIDLELSATQFNILGALFQVGSQNSNPYELILVNYFNDNFDPKDKRHIHIMLIASAIMCSNPTFKKIVEKNKNNLSNDDYGKYLLAYYFPKKGVKLISGQYWSPKIRVFERICGERDGKFKKFPFISMVIEHPFKKVLFADYTVKLDPLYTALCGYIHEFSCGRWSVAFNKLQMVTHESVKYLYGVDDGSKGKDIIKTLKDNGLKISTYEERDFLSFWERRNFNPISHGSKNGLTAPEVTYEELIIWENKIGGLINKIFY